MKSKICSLRKSIFELAIKGELVAQNFDEIPFELPYDKDKNDTLIVKENCCYFELFKKVKKPIEDIPFDIPDNWKFARFKCLFDLYTGDSIPQNVKEAKYTKCDLQNSTPYIGTKDVGFNHVIDYNNGVRIPNNELSLFRQAHDGDILLCIEGGSAGKKIGIVDRVVCFGNKLMCFRAKYQNIPLIYYFLQSPTFSNVFNDSLTGIITGISKKNLENLIFPLPPIEEQNRIVEKLRKLEPLIDEYEMLEREREYLDVAFPNKIRLSLLKDAIEGNLTNHNYDDKSAKDIVDAIIKEKNNLVKNKICKKDKCLQKIEEIEKPFKKPDNWEWIHFGELGILKKGPFGSDLTKSMFVPKGPDAVKVYEQKNAIDKDWKLGEYFIKKEYFDSKMFAYKVEPGDVIVSCAGTIGETYVIPDDAELGIINQALMRMKISKEIDLKYFLYYFDFILKNSANKESKGTAIKNIPPFDLLKNMLVAIPPLEEQKRIVKKLDYIEFILNDL